MLKITHKDLVEQAMAEVETLSVSEAAALLEDPQVQWVDLRDYRELQREGKVPGAYNANRGMIEFWIDPTSPYYKDEVFGSAKRFVFYCQSGWRSALATQTVQRMGLEGVAHIAGGYRAWKDAGLPTEAVVKK